eukprot:TRINITY_DN5881_c0_g1_i2.p1 TRINITY_DN5881_c0_g1~~TRINITY_DN5881_c0_g1_i2.p1  ORF type:complete len:151 (+),score=15.28 TRINITY_DN5881_c0_g1_i2:255-707(+)
MDIPLYTNMSYSRFASVFESLPDHCRDEYSLSQMCHAVLKRNPTKRNRIYMADAFDIWAQFSDNLATTAPAKTEQILAVLKEGLFDKILGMVYEMTQPDDLRKAVTRLEEETGSDILDSAFSFFREIYKQSCKFDGIFCRARMRWLENAC